MEELECTMFLKLDSELFYAPGVLSWSPGIAMGGIIEWNS